MFEWKLQTVIFYIMSVALIKKKEKATLLLQNKRNPWKQWKNCAANKFSSYELPSLNSNSCKQKVLCICFNLPRKLKGWKILVLPAKSVINEIYKQLNYQMSDLNLLTGDVHTTTDPTCCFLAVSVQSPEAECLRLSKQTELSHCWACSVYTNLLLQIAIA